MSAVLSENHHPGNDLANRLRSSMTRVTVPSWTTLTENGESCVSFKVSLNTPHSSTTVYRRFANFSEMHLALTKQLPNLDFPALPHVTNTASSSKLEEQRIELEKYLNRITKISESWSCPVFGSFFCVQTDLSAAELTAGIVGRILTLGQENIILSDQLKATNSALLEATAHIQQLESRLALLEHGGVGSARASNSRSGSVSIAGERGSDGALPVLYGASKAKHRFSYVSTASDLDSIASNSVCFDDTEQLPSPLGDRRPSGVPVLFLPDARKYRRPSEQRSTYFSLAGDVLHENVADQSTVLKTLQTFSMREEPGIFDSRLEEIMVSILPQKLQVSQRSDVQSFISSVILSTLGAQVIDIGHYRLRCYLPDEALELGITVQTENEKEWCEKLVKAFGGLSHLETNDDSASSFRHKDASYAISNFLVIPPEGQLSTSWKLQFSVESVAVCITEISKVELCIVAFFEDLDQLIGRDHLFKRSIILIRAWWQYESKTIIGDFASSWIPHRWLICSMISVIFNKYGSRIYHPLHALILFFSEFAYFDWEHQVLTLNGTISKIVYNTVRSKIENDGKRDFLIDEVLISKYQALAKSFVSDATESAFHNLDGIFVEHPLLSGVNLFFDSESDIDSTSFVIALKSGVLLLCEMLCATQELSRGAVDNFFAGTIAKLGERMKLTSIQIRSPNGRDGLLSPLVNSSSFKNAESISSWWNFGFSSSPTKDRDALYISTAADDVLASQQADGLRLKAGSGFTSGTLSENHSIIGSYRPTLYGSSSLLNSSSSVSPSRISSPVGSQHAQVSEYMLKSLALDILSAKGPLPVGEIGKMLQEVIRVPSLSSVLREYFGGLKKFLEKYTDDFLISNDHPFNPNVYIRSLLTPDDLAVIAKGRMPMHFELTYKKKGSNRKKNSKIQGGLHNILPQTQLGDDVQSQLTQYFSSLSCSGNASHNASNPGPISHSDHHWGSALDINAQKEILGIDRSMRRRSYPHEDFNTSKMLKSLFGKDGLDVENRLSDPFPSMEGYGTVSQLLNESLFGTAEADELWHRPASIVRAEGDASEHFGQPNPQAPVFIPQRSRFSS